MKTKCSLLNEVHGHERDLYQAQKGHLLHVTLGHMALSHYLPVVYWLGQSVTLRVAVLVCLMFLIPKEILFFSVFFFHASGPTSTKSRCQWAGLVLSEGS